MPASSTAPASPSCERCGDYIGRPPTEAGPAAPGFCSACHAHLSSRREASLRGEKSLRRLSTTFYLLALLAGVIALVGLVLLGEAVSIAPHMLVLGAGLGVIAAITGLGLARLRPWAIWSGVLLAAPLILIFPLGTILGGEALVTLVRHRALTSDDHRELVRLTPEHTPTEFSRWQLYVIAALLVLVVCFVIFRIAWP